VGSLSADAELALPTDEDRADELEFWSRAEAEATAEAYAAYLEQYPDGVFAHTAQNRLEDLQGGDQDFAAREEDALALDDAQRRGIAEALGVQPGNDPVVFGPEIRDAIRGWQLDNGQQPTGFLTREQARQILSPSQQ
jgi:hypothetical protein